MEVLRYWNLLGSIGLGYFFIFLSSVMVGQNISPSAFKPWMAVSLFFALRFIYLGKAGFYSGRNLNVFWVLFLLILIVNSSISLVLGGDVFRVGLQIATIFGFAYLLVSYPPRQKDLDRVLLPIITILCLFGLMQAAAYIFGLPVVGSSFYSGRGAPGFQATSIFKESAHFSGFLVASAYYVAFTDQKRRTLLLILIVLTALATKSVGGLTGVVFIIFMASITTGSRAIMGSAAIALAMVLTNTEVLIWVFQRLENEVFSKLHLIGGTFVPHQIGGLGSGAIRTINELNYLLDMPVHALVFGNGFGYDTYSAGRLMALNGLVEIVARGGVLSAVVFLAAVVREKVIFPPRSRIVFCVTLFFIFFVDGAIAKLAFWLPVAMLLLTDRVWDQREKGNRHKSTLRRCPV